MVAIQPLKEISEQYLSLLRRYESDDDIGIDRYKCLIGEIKLFWYRHKRFVDYFLNNISEDDEVYFLAGAIRLDISIKGHYEFIICGRYRLLNDPFLKFASFYRMDSTDINIDYFNAYLRECINDVIEMLHEYPGDFYVVSLECIDDATMQDYTSALISTAEKMVLSMFSVDYTNTEHFYSENNSYEDIEAKLLPHIKETLSDASGNSVTSDVATVGFENILKITKQPQSVKSSGYGKPVTVGLTAEGSGLKYSWEYQWPKATTWSKFNVGNGSASIKVAMEDQRYEGLKVRCVVSDASGNSVTSDVATLGFDSSDKPFDLVGLFGDIRSDVYGLKDTTTYEGVIPRVGYPPMQHILLYLDKARPEDNMQVIEVRAGSLDGDMSPVEITKSDTITAGDLNFLLPTSINGSECIQVTFSVNGKTYVVNFKTGEYYNGGIKITKQPVSVDGNAGTNVTLSVEAQGDKLSYQWYSCPKYARPEVWSEVYAESAGTANLTINVNDSTADMCYKCVITNEYGKSVETNRVLVRNKNNIVTNGAMTFNL